MHLSRKDFLKAFAATLTTGALTSLSPATLSGLQQEQGAGGDITLDDLRAASKVAGVTFTEDELKAILRMVQAGVKNAIQVRKTVDDWQISPSTHHVVYARKLDDHAGKGSVTLAIPSVEVSRPSNSEDLLFMTVVELGELIRSKQVTSQELTELALARLKRYGKNLRCLINLCEIQALEDARRADAETQNGKNRGPLHGIPYGIKDLFATKGVPTTWGAGPYRDQVFDFDAFVVEKLREAGAVLVAKLSLGALAMGDVWFEGRTESPWDARIGASGSSAGSASAVAAGLVPFAIGTETSGSIVSPCHNCRVTGLRPSFGSISRAGAMPLCWSLDKVGPICHDAQDCAVIFASLVGRDLKDPSSLSRGFQYEGGRALKDLKIGYFMGDPSKEIDEKDKPWLTKLREMGADLKRMTLPKGDEGLYAILFAECSAAFDSFTTSEKIRDLKNSSWPNTFRASRFVSAVDLVQAERAREVLAQQYHETLKEFDVVVVDDRAYPIIYQLNLTGEPQVLVPYGTTQRGAPRSFSLIGPSFSEGVLLDVAYQVQKASGTLGKQPDLSSWAG
ncbi:MAG: amidase [Fimbriimonadaceae bacterium]|jgi:Asp-tRNA(Asn)/Glu-tRNA(Gln) amidotransferase A subunit family amidase|nr:amidase [Fimbriimonadaceae bacterium]